MNWIIKNLFVFNNHNNNSNNNEKIKVWTQQMD